VVLALLAENDLIIADANGQAIPKALSGVEGKIRCCTANKSK
jgi:hypothetical protein